MNDLAEVGRAPAVETDPPAKLPCGTLTCQTYGECTCGYAGSTEDYKPLVDIRHHGSNVHERGNASKGAKW